MTHLNIQQGLNVEVVSTNLIKKLYEAALSVPEPLEGELDAAYMSGNLLVDRTYRTYVLYLTGRFSNLHINVTDSYYIPFEDSAVLSALLANNISSDGVGITEDDVLAVTSMSLLGLAGNTSISSFVELKEFKNIASSSTNDFAGCTNLEWIALPDNNYNLSTSFQIDGGKTLKWVVPSVAFACSRTFESWYNNPGRGGDGDHTWTLYNLNKQPITDVVIPEGTTTIGKYVFSKMSCNSISIPSSVTSISWAAFENTHTVQPFTLNSLGVTTIERQSFRGSTLSEINIPNLTNLAVLGFRDNSTLLSVISLGKISNIPTESFAVCNGLTSVIIPYECTNIADNAFINCTSLTTIKLYTQSVNDWTEGTIPSSTNIGRVTVFGLACLRGCLLLTLTNADITNATSIGQTAFYDCKNLTGAITLPNLASLGYGAFYGCSGITSVDFTGSTITSIPADCFRGCTSLVSAVFPSTVTVIKNSAFSGCGITSILDLSNIVSLEYGGFGMHPDWEFVVNLANVTDLGLITIGRTNGTCRVKQIYIPKITHTYDNGYYNNFVYYRGAFCGLNSDLIYLRDILVLHPGDFASTVCANLVINNTTPPVWNNNGDRQDSEVTDNTWRRTLVFENSNITSIYVPDSAVITYLNDTYWSTLANKIKPLSQLTKVATEADLLANQIALIEAYM